MKNSTQYLMESRGNLKDLVKIIKKDAIEYTLKVASEKAVVEVVDHEEMTPEQIPPHDGKSLILPVYGVDDDSILSLKDELFKEIDNE